MQTPSVLAAMGEGVPGRMYHSAGRGLVGGINAPLTPLQIKSMQRNVPRTSMLNTFYSSGTVESSEAAAERFAGMSNRTDVGGRIEDSDSGSSVTSECVFIIEVDICCGYSSVLLQNLFFLK